MIHSFNIKYINLLYKNQSFYFFYCVKNENAHFVSAKSVNTNTTYLYNSYFNTSILHFIRTNQDFGFIYGVNI